MALRLALTRLPGIPHSTPPPRFAEARTGYAWRRVGVDCWQSLMGGIRDVEDVRRYMRVAGVFNTAHPSRHA